MTEWYWVSYLILDDATGAMPGHGSIELEMAGPPGTAHEVSKLADRITDLSRDKGTLLGTFVHVQSWSKMGA